MLNATNTQHHVFDFITLVGSNYQNYNCLVHDRAGNQLLCTSHSSLKILKFNSYFYCRKLGV